jgi:hypothetical protein
MVITRSGVDHLVQYHQHSTGSKYWSTSAWRCVALEQRPVLDSLTLAVKHSCAEPLALAACTIARASAITKI